VREDDFDHYKALVSVWFSDPTCLTWSDLTGLDDVARAFGADLAAHWAQHNVRLHHTGTKTFHHPEVGPRRVEELKARDVGRVGTGGAWARALAGGRVLGGEDWPVHGAAEVVGGQDVHAAVADDRGGVVTESSIRCSPAQLRAPLVVV
jgi:hypothetical protein